MNLLISGDQKHTLFRDVKALCSIWIVISTSKKFPENWIIPTKIGGGQTIAMRQTDQTYGFLTPLGLMCHPDR